MSFIMEDQKKQFNELDAKRWVIITCSINDTEYELVLSSESFEYVESLCSQNEFKLGLTESDNITFEYFPGDEIYTSNVINIISSEMIPIDELKDITGLELTVKYISNNISINLGKFTVISCTPDQNNLLITCNASRKNSNSLLELSYTGKQRYNLSRQVGKYGGICCYMLIENMPGEVYMPTLSYDELQPPSDPGNMNNTYPLIPDEVFIEHVNGVYSIRVIGYEVVGSEKYMYYRRPNAYYYVIDETQEVVTVEMEDIRNQAIESFETWLRTKTSNESDIKNIMNIIKQRTSTYVRYPGLSKFPTGDNPATTNDNIMICNDSIPFYGYIEGLQQQIVMPCGITVTIENETVFSSYWDGPSSSASLYPSLWQSEEIKNDVYDTISRLSMKFMLEEDEIDNFSFQKFFEAYCELLGAFGKIGRDNYYHFINYLSIANPGHILYPYVGLKPDPVALYPGSTKGNLETKYEHVTADQCIKYKKNKSYVCYDSVSVTYDNTEGIKKQKSKNITPYKAEDIKGKNYSLAYNYIVDHSLINDNIMDEIMNNVINILSRISYYPGTLKCLGMPWVEAGYLIEVDTEDGAALIPVFKRTMTGIYMLIDEIEAD